MSLKYPKNKENVSEPYNGVLFNRKANEVPVQATPWRSLEDTKLRQEDTQRHMGSRLGRMSALGRSTEGKADEWLPGLVVARDAASLLTGTGLLSSVIELV